MIDFSLTIISTLPMAAYRDTGFSPALMYAPLAAAQAKRLVPGAILDAAPLRSEGRDINVASDEVTLILVWDITMHEVNTCLPSLP
ncbi:hypothetical protein EKD04_009545 [Chloroflexales bacterium ZM16-3]|nr:hypothetical protein [Chloroflexales bacterium ZM16-3]